VLDLGLNLKGKSMTSGPIKNEMPKLTAYALQVYSMEELQSMSKNTLTNLGILLDKRLQKPTEPTHRPTHH
jgi:hypothetical protein